MLKRDQIIPFLDTAIRSYASPPKFAGISTCHRVIAHVLLRKHYRNDDPQCIRHTFEDLTYSPETIRRAVKDGVDMDVIEVVQGGDKRYKKIRATKLLVETFEAMHVESTD